MKLCNNFYPYYLQNSSKILNRFPIVIFLILLNNVSYGQQNNVAGTAGMKGFRAAVIEIDITPDNSQNLLGYGARKSTGVHDPIYNRIVEGEADLRMDPDDSVLSDERYIQSTKKSLKSIRNKTKPSIGIIGNSTIARHAGGESIAALMNETSAYSITDISVPGYTIHQEDSLWRAIPIGVKQSLNYVFVEIGLNDLAPDESALEALTRYQSLINLIRSETNKSCKIITNTMTPCKQRLINLYGNKELIAYKKWLDMNTAIIGMVPYKIINFDSYCNSHTNELSEGEGDLAASYDTGDGIHETTKARQIIANEWMAKVMWYNDRK